MSYERIHSAKKAYDVAVYIGRFQPFHRGHFAVVEEALAQAEEVVILIGSANLSRDTRNPFTFKERAAVISDVLDREYADWEGRWQDRVTILPLNDTPYDKPAWINSVHHAARSVTQALRPRICLTGHIRDQTSEYLTWFPAWDYLPASSTVHNASAVRSVLFAGGVNFHKKSWQDQGIDWDDYCHPATIDFLSRFRGTEHYPYLMKQKAAEIAYKEQWGEGPFQTVDPVIVKGDHVLMIERGGLEGEGSIGLPGGFLNKFERLADGAVREGIEETSLFIPDHEQERFESYLRAQKTKTIETPAFMKNAQATLMSYLRGRGERFDDPRRSRRGHLITEAFLFMLPDGHGLPPVLACDDASKAFWMPISEVRPDNSFEDHSFIIDRMLSLHG